VSQQSGLSLHIVKTKNSITGLIVNHIRLYISRFELMIGMAGRTASLPQLNPQPPLERSFWGR
jgi:hypothetical protein